MQLSNAEFDFTNEILVTPNPVQTVLNIKTSISIKEILIFDLLGKKIELNQIAVKSIDVTNLAKGTYIIKIISDNNFSLGKLFAG